LKQILNALAYDRVVVDYQSLLHHDRSPSKHRAGLLWGHVIRFCNAIVLSHITIRTEYKQYGVFVYQHTPTGNAPRDGKLRVCTGYLQAWYRHKRPLRSPRRDRPLEVT
jgi:hypothetical protein